MQIKCQTKVLPSATSDEIIQTILAGRGYTSSDSIATFLTPPPLSLEYLYQESGISHEALMNAKKLIDSHLAQNHDICIFGDYDADGVTATAVLYLGLKEYIAKKSSTSRLLPFIPDRHRHGYGLSSLAVSEVMSGQAFASSSYSSFRPELIITVDTGIVAHDGITTMKQAGSDVIITDHHQSENVLPPADTIVHTLTTSGAGVAWILSSHLLGNVTTNLDLATIGVVADMMPLCGFNRSLIKQGLSALTRTGNRGLLALFSRMGIPKRPLSTYDISFGIAPRINAAGRIYSPLDALHLLCTTDPEVARTLADTIEVHNTDRQSLTDVALTHALSQHMTHKLIALAGPYHEGVIGLVAGKIVEKVGRPAIVISQNGDVCKGSARSVPGFNITSFLRSLSLPFLGLGGHDQAAGFSIAQADLPELISTLERRGDTEIADELLVRSERADLSLSLSQTSLELARKLLALEPYGLGNTKPRFLFTNDILPISVVQDRSLGAEGKHHKLTLESGGVTRDLLMFNSTSSHPITSLHQFIATLDINVWNNKESLQLIASYVET